MHQIKVIDASIVVQPVSREEGPLVGSVTGAISLWPDMQTRHDVYTLELTANAEAGGEYDVKISYKMTLANLQDMIGSIIEATPHASSFVISVVVHKTVCDSHEIN